EPFRLVLDLGADLVERIAVLAAVVRAEEQLARAGEHDTHVCLGATTVAQVHGGQRLARSHSTGHVASSVSSRRAPNPAGVPFVHPSVDTQHSDRPSRSHPVAAYAKSE